MTSVWIITKDIRLDDNYVLNKAIKDSKCVIPLFIYDSKQFEEGGKNSVYFLMESLKALNKVLIKNDLGVNFIDKKDLKDFVEKNKVTNAYINKAYTIFEEKRNKKYNKIVNVIEVEDSLGWDYSDLLSAKREPYVIFTSMYKKAPTPLEPKTFKKFNKLKYVKCDSDFLSSIEINKPEQSEWKGGSKVGKRLLKKGLSGISPHIKFGTISVREAYHSNISEESKRGLYWRAFYMILFKNDMCVRKDLEIEWDNKHFKAWTKGKTGFDLVDAGITELKLTGSMNNITRMLCANFLVFGLKVDWRLGEQFFREHLVDYDWALNLGNWAWCAQVGVDRPRFKNVYGSFVRIYNPDTYKNKTRDEKEWRNSYLDDWLIRKDKKKIVNFNDNVKEMLTYYT